MITRQYRYSINKLPWCVLSLAENQSVEQTIFYTVYHFPTPHIINKKNTFFMSRTTNLDNCSNVPWHQHAYLWRPLKNWNIWSIFSWPFCQGQIVSRLNTQPFYQGCSSHPLVVTDQGTDKVTYFVKFLDQPSYVLLCPAPWILILALDFHLCPPRPAGNCSAPHIPAFYRVFF